MKAPLLALTVIATSMGFAQESREPAMQTSSNGQCSSCCCTPCCCKPCCVPKPPKCIDCECYVPQHYDMSCDCGLFLSVDFLYFYGRESNLPYGTVNTAVPQVNELIQVDQTNFFGASELLYVDGKWDPGFRIGFGWKDECDGWDLSFFWTWYKNSSSDSKQGTLQSPGQVANLGDTALNSYWIQSGGLPYAKLSGKWEFQFNSFDLEMGRRYWLSKCFDLRPYFGLRGAWGETEFKVAGSGGISNQQTFGEFFTSGFIDFDNNNWGVGFLGGVQPVWHFSECFKLYSNFDMSLIWGRRKLKHSERTTLTFLNGDLAIDRPFSSSSDSYGMQTALDLGLGLRYENCYCDNQYRFALDLGWEHHIWLNYNERFTNTPSGNALGSQIISTNNLTDHDVMFGGFVLRARFDF